jgi:carbonic anhydrase
VHRNIANIITSTDTSAQSVIDYAVWKLGVKTIVVCGHTNCGGAAAALGPTEGLGANLDKQLSSLSALRKSLEGEMAKVEDAKKGDWLATRNVKLSVEAIKDNEHVKKGLEDGSLEVVGAMYDVGKGELSVLDLEAL